MPRQVPLPLPTPMERITELERKVRELEAKLAAESTIAAAVADGKQTIASIVTALQTRASSLGQPGTGMHVTDFDRELFLARELHLLAGEIQRQAETGRLEAMLNENRDEESP